MSKELIIPIDRTVPFDTVTFLGREWRIKEEDKRALALTQLNLSDVRLEHMLQAGETRIWGDEKLKRLKAAGFILLDAKVFQILWGNPELIPGSWKIAVDDILPLICFHGTIFQKVGGDTPSPYILRLYLSTVRQKWVWDVVRDDGSHYAHEPSAVLPD